MPKVEKTTTIKEYQAFVNDVYLLPNDRYYEISEMLVNVQRFGTRGLKGIRKNNAEKTKKYLMISFSWFMSIINRLHIDLESEIWKRFPNLCSYCGKTTCACKAEKLKKRAKIQVDESKKPKKLSDYQKMFKRIYPPKSRSLDHAGVHLAEELGEFSEAFNAYRGERKDKDFIRVGQEAADYFSCLIGVFNSLNIDLATEIAKLFPKNCHECHKVPCECSYRTVKNYEFK